jgi:hypothetical protein
MAARTPFIGGDSIDKRPLVIKAEGVKAGSNIDMRQRGRLFDLGYDAHLFQLLDERQPIPLQGAICLEGVGALTARGECLELTTTPRRAAA